MAVFSQTVWEIEKAVSICRRNNSTKQKGKKSSTSHYRSKFRAQRYEDKLPKKSWKALNRKRRCALHASMVSEGFANFIPKEERPANSRDVNALETIWIIVDEIPYKRSSPKNIGRAKTVTTLRLEECAFGHALGTRTFYTPPLRNCQKTHRKTFWPGY